MSFLLISVFIVSFIVFFICVFMQLELLGAIIFSLWILSPLLFYILLAFHTKKYPKNSIEDYNNFSIYKSNSDITIFVSKENGYWLFICQNNQVKLALKGYLFQKTYILAYLNRQIKYSLHHLTIRQFFKCKLEVKKYRNIDIYPLSTHISNSIYKAVFIYENSYIFFKRKSEKKKKSKIFSCLLKKIKKGEH